MAGDTYLFTGGGTGGHIYPGVAVAEQILQKDPKARVVFVGARRGIEARIFPKIKYPFHLLYVGPLNRVSKPRLLLSLFQLPFAILYAVWLILRYRPKSIIGYGGYASSPLLIAAYLLNRRFYQWEGNAHPGMVTRKLIAKATNTFLAFPSESPIYKKYKSMVVGVPTRFSAVAKETKPSRDKFNLLIFGGSQGAKAINESFSDFMVNNLAYLDKLEVIHQVGKNNLDQVPQSLKDHPSYNAVEFIHDMKEKYQWADFSISRAGASTISELTQMGLPSVLVPLPTAADDHQKKNALWVAEAGAGVLLEQKDLSHEQWVSVLEQMLDWDRLEVMSGKALGVAQVGAASRIALEIF